MAGVVRRVAGRFGRRGFRRSIQERSATALPIGLTVALVAALFVVAAPAEPASAAASPAIIDNGTIQMGVHPEGHLNVPGGTASSGSGTTDVGLRYMPTNAEATAPGCLCEGWGVGDAISNISGSANAADGIFNVSPVSFTATANSARSVVDVGSTFRVTHDYSPSMDDRLYAVTVSIENISPSAVDVRYRRVMDWDVEPTAFSEHVTARTGDTSLLLYNNNDGFASADPLGSRTSGSVSPLVTGEFTDVGPTDHGALFDFGFGMLQAGETKTFRTFYGAAATETDALDALASVGARLYSLGQPSTTDGPTLGTPNTFVFGFGDLGLVDGPLTEEQNRGPGNEFHRHNPQCSVGKPVNCATGNFWHTFFDLGVPGRGPALGVARTYNASRADMDGPFGFGWSSPISMRLATAADGTVTVHQGSGSIVRFSPDGSGGFTSLRRVMATLTQDANGYELIGHRRQIFRFDTAGRLVSERDVNGYQLSYSYDTNGQLTQITDAAGRALTFTHDTAGRITQVSDPANRTVSYTYDTSGDLTSVTDVAGGTTTFVYDAAHRMVSMTDPRGGVVSNVYDSSSRVTQQTDRDGGVTTFQYSDTVTTITDPNGNVKRQEYLDGVLTAATKGFGTTAEATWRYTYDPATLGTETVTDPNGNVTSYTYDQYGNTLTAVDPLDRGTTATYGPHNELTSVTDPAGATASLVYDANANLLSISRPLAGTTDTQTTTFTYGDTAHPGDVTATTDPTNRTWQLQYDAAGNLTVATDPAGAATTHSYNGIGWRTATVSPRGNASGADPTAYTTSYSHNPFGQVTTATDPTGGVTTYTYDPNGNVVSLTDPDGNVTGYTYDAADRPTLVTRADGTTLSSGYDANGNLVNQSDAAGNVTSYAYDALNRVISSTDPLTRTTTFGYDPAGNQTTVIDPAGQTTSLSYDAADQLTGIAYSDGSTPSVSYSYDTKGRRTSMTDGTGTSSYTWDSLDRLVSTTNGTGQTVGYTYDLAGRTTGITYPNANTVTHAYDPVGRLTSVTDWLTNTTTFNYDPDGNLIGDNRPNSTTSAYAFDPAGRVTGIDHTGPAGLLASFDYTRTASGLLASTTTSPSAPAESYGYTPLDQLESVNTDTYNYDPADNITKLLDGTTLSYDAASQLTGLTRPDGTMASFGYDSRGNRTSGPAPDGNHATYSYDQANRLTGVSSGTTGTTQLAGGQNHSIAALPDGTVWTWGNNGSGQLGDGTTTSATTPVQVTDVAATAVAAGISHSLALRTDGTVAAWGANPYGQLGDGTTTSRTTPVAVAGLGGVVGVAAGNYHSLAVTGDGSVRAWGYNGTGQLGDGTTTSRTTPVQVPGLDDVVAVAGGGISGWSGHSLALRADGTVWAWGYNKTGQLGDGTKNHRASPVQVTSLTDIVAIAANGDNGYALRADGTVWAWGDNSYNQLGNTTAGKTSAIPVQAGITGVDAIAAGGTHVLARKTDGTVWAWGNNNTGQLGNGAAGPGNPKTTATPVQTQGLTEIAALGAGYVHSLAADANTLWAWGANSNGQLGNGTTTAATSPSAVAGLEPGEAAPATQSTYTYDGDGLRASKTTTAGTQQFTWDIAGGLPLMLADGNASYIYGPDNLPVAHITHDGTVRYYHHDQLGSTRLLTDQTGTVVGTTTYNPHGTITDSTGEQPVLGYAGEYTDTETGLVYLRARYHDPTTGQFLTRDPLVGFTGQPYGYAGNNSLNYTDPTGLCWGPTCIVEDVIGAGDDLLEGGAELVDDAWDYSYEVTTDAIDDTADWAWRNRDTIGAGLAVVGGMVCTAGTAGTAAVVCVSATVSSLGLSYADARADGDMGDFYLDVGLQLGTLGLGRFAGSDEILRMVTNASGASLDILLNIGEAACWDGY